MKEIQKMVHAKTLKEGSTKLNELFSNTAERLIENSVTEH